MQVLQKVGLLALFVNLVELMSLSGPVHTRYDPCGLDIIYFDKYPKKNNVWKGVVNLGLYLEDDNPVFEINFERPVRITQILQNTTLEDDDGSQTFVFKPFGILPQLFKFDVKVKDLNEDESDIPTVNKFLLNNVTLCDESIKESQSIDALNVTESDYGGYKHICGRRSMDNTELVSIRTEARAGDWPWHIAVLKNKDGVENYVCGGNILSRTAILTAGHCVTKKKKVVLDPEEIVIVAGVNNYKDLSQIGRQELIVKSVVVHPAYTTGQSTSDLAIIRVSKMRYTDYVQPICLWGPAYDKTLLYNQEAIVVGFGRTENDELSDVLRASNTMVQADEECINFAEEAYGHLLNEFTFCAGYGPDSDLNPRNGDSGGGLVVSNMQPEHKISWFLRGVLSRCATIDDTNLCDPNSYVIYTDVGPHYGWIYHHSGLKFEMNIV